MKKLILVLLVATLLTSCIESKDPIFATQGGETISGLITSNKTFTNDRIWTLSGKVVVENGVTLTIEPGTIIKAEPGVEAAATALIVARGGKINAVGTTSQPIIFTTVSDNIAVGQTAGTNLDENDRGYWGGVLILGYAPCSVDGNVTEVQIEGIPANDTFGLYGGTDPEDDSGNFRYVSIRHGGALIGDGNEINGLTLGGVGSGTSISHIEVVGNVDDGVEFFGGTVNASDLLVWSQGDDGLDIDQAYSGTISDSMVILGPISDHALEIDGPEGVATGSFTLNNITLIGDENAEGGEYADYRDGATGASNNIFARGFKTDSDVELDNNGVAENFNDGSLTFGTWQVVLPTGVADVSNIFINKADAVTVTGFGSTATAVSEGNETVGAGSADFSWTYAASKNAF